MDSHWYVIAIGLFEREIKTWSLLIKEHQCFCLMGKRPSLKPTFCKSIQVSFSESSGQSSFMYWHVLKWSSISTPKDEWWTYRWSMMILQVTSKLVTHVFVSLWYLMCIFHDPMRTIRIHLHFLHHLNTEPIVMPHYNPSIPTIQGLQVQERCLCYTPVKLT